MRDILGAANANRLKMCLNHIAEISLHNEGVVHSLRAGHAT